MSVTSEEKFQTSLMLDLEPVVVEPGIRTGMPPVSGRVSWSMMRISSDGVSG